MLAAVGLVFTLVLGARPASALTLEDPATGLKLPLDGPTSRVCSLLPRGPADDKACEGLDVEKMASHLERSGELKTAAYVTLPDVGYLVGFKGFALAIKSQESIEEFVSGMKSGAPPNTRIEGDIPGRSYDLIKVGQADVIHLRMLIGDNGYSEAYVFVGDSASTMVVFGGQQSSIKAVRAEADRLLANSTMRASHDDDFGKSRAYLMGYHGAKALGPVVLLVIFVVLAIRDRRKRNAAPPAPPGGPPPPF